MSDNFLELIDVEGINEYRPHSSIEDMWNYFNRLIRGPKILGYSKRANRKERRARRSYEAHFQRLTHDLARPILMMCVERSGNSSLFPLPNDVLRYICRYFDTSMKWSIY